MNVICSIRIQIICYFFCTCSTCINSFSCYFFFKILISALVVAAVSELGKRFSWLAAILASLPLTSLLAIVWLYRDTGDVQKIIELSKGIFWAVLPSLLFFLILPILLKYGVRFWAALTISCLLMFLGYAVYSWTLKRLGVAL